MKKKLVFYFYIKDNNIESEIYRLHLYCLRHYAHVFDEMLFVLSLDDTNDIDLIRKWENVLMGLHTKGTISFEIMKNNTFRETDAFKRHIADRLGEDDLVFFGHGKGLTNMERYDKDNIMKWVVGMYFYNLNFMDEVENELIANKYMSYGAFLSKCGNDDHINKFRWFYCGTFMWINSKALYNFVKGNGIELPKYSDRYYDEEFLGNIYDIWPQATASSHNHMYLLDAFKFYHETDNYISGLYNDRSDFDEFYNKVKSEM